MSLDGFITPNERPIADDPLVEVANATDDLPEFLLIVESDLLANGIPVGWLPEDPHDTPDALAALAASPQTRLCVPQRFMADAGIRYLALEADYYDLTATPKPAAETPVADLTARPHSIVRQGPLPDFATPFAPGEADAPPNDIIHGFSETRPDERALNAAIFITVMLVGLAIGAALYGYLR